MLTCNVELSCWLVILTGNIDKLCRLVMLNGNDNSNNGNDNVELDICYRQSGILGRAGSTLVKVGFAWYIMQIRICLQKQP